MDNIATFKVHEALQDFEDHHKLIALIHSMAQELERLEEDNAQLRAAVLIYREVVERGRQARAAH